MLRAREIIPPLTLHTFDGRTIRAWDFKQKKNLVIAFLHAGCAHCEQFLHELAASSAVWKQTDAIVLAAFLELLTRSLADLLPDNVIAGVDSSGHAANAYLGRDTLAPAGVTRLGVFLADRYGELFAQWEIAASHRFPALAEICSLLDRIEMSCDACSAPLSPLDD
ncbi:MAG: hypothetical protein WA755_12100 [Candidatus Acidiferrales bacterium]